MPELENYRSSPINVDFPAEESARQQALFALVSKIRQSLTLDRIFESTAKEVRQLLNADRVGMYRFDPASNYSWGEFVSEAVIEPYPSALAAKVEDHCFGEKYAALYRQGRVWTCSDIHTAKLPDCHREILDRFQVRANLVVPLLIDTQLWGLLCIHQCQPRLWQDTEIEFIAQVAIHLGIALQQAEYVERLQQQSQQLNLAVDRAVKREKAVAEIIDKIRRSLDIKTIFRTTTDEVRQLLQVDRVVIYRFNSDWSGEFVVESVAEGWQSLLEKQIFDPSLPENISECSVTR
jgi:GAF domain-containing protein